jgi:hypothetical protein
MYVLFELSFFCFQTPTQMNETLSSWFDLRLSRLRSVTFTFDPISVVRSQRVYIIDQILDASPRLSHLVVAWNDLRHCSRPNTNVKHIQLELDHHCDMPNKHIHISRLFQLLPRVSYFETSGGNIAFNENLVKFVLKIINTFDQLVELTLNKESYCPVKPETQLTIQQAIFAANSERPLTSNTCQIIFPQRNKLRIWL